MPSKGTEMVYWASAAPSSVMVAGTGGAPAGAALVRVVSRGRMEARVAKAYILKCV